MPLTTIKIFGTSNSPYARLSDNFKQDMTIDNKLGPQRRITSMPVYSIHRSIVLSCVMQRLKDLVQEVSNVHNIGDPGKNVRRQGANTK